MYFICAFFAKAANGQKLKLILLLLLLLLIFLSWIFTLSGPNTFISQSERPIILGWTEFEPGQSLVTDLFFTNYNESECPYKCFYTDDKMYARNASVFVFFIPRLNVDNLPLIGRDILTVFFNQETPSITERYKQVPRDYFNISISYRRDSDIFLPYDSFKRITTDAPDEDIWHENEIIDKLKKKTKLVLQIVSNCNTSSKREDYTTELSKFIDVSIYGRCNGNLCGIHGQPSGTSCVTEQIEEHLFYLAFENGICKHYVTEKFWRAIKRLTVPVVLSRRPFDGLDIPSDSYIAASDFESAKHLASYLIHLRDNPDEYLKYFSWTKTYRKTGVTDFIINYADSTKPLCQLCKWATERRRVRIDDIIDFWDNGSKCSNVYDERLITKN